MQRYRSHDYQQLKASGQLAQRLAFARQIGNHRVDAGRLQQAIVRTARDFLAKKGLPEVEIARLAFLPPLPPARGGVPTTGAVKIFALLIDFPDQPHTNAEGAIHTALFGPSTAGAPFESLAAYYSRASYGKLDMSGGATLGWYRASKKRSEVDQSTAGREGLIKEALNHFNAAGHDFRQYDNNGDGVIDYFLVFWTGPDNGWGNFWWGYQTSFSDHGYKLDGVGLGKYSWQWESNPVGSGFNVQVPIHETGHALGLPDLYDYDDSVGPKGGVGGLDVMDANVHDHNGFSKWMLGWLTPTIIDADRHTLTLAPTGTAGDVVAIWPGLRSHSPFSEIFLVQNRQRVGNDVWLPSEGLLVWHIDATLDAAGQDFVYNNSFSAHKLVRLMEYDAREDIEANRSADAGDFYGTGAVFAPSTTPSSARYDGSPSFVAVRNVSTAGGRVTATFEVGVVPLDVLVHLQDIGDRTYHADDFAGTRGQSRRLEAFLIQFAPPVPGLSMRYKAHLQDVGATPFVNEGQLIGTRGQSRRLEAFAIELTGPSAGQYDVSYMAHLQGLGDTPFAMNGELCGTRGQSRRVEGVRVRVTRRDPAAVRLAGIVHLQEVGDLPFHADDFAGTRGQSRRLEGFQLRIDPPIPGLSLRYKAHVQDIGDTPWLNEGQLAGTRGQSRRLEGFAIELTGPSAVQYDVSYMAHLEGSGDTPFLRNGEFCGTRGQSRRVEGMAVRIARRRPAAVQLDVLVHLQDIGDRVYHADDFAGTRGQSRRLEGFQIQIVPPVAGLSMRYMAHLQGIGDTPLHGEGQFVGTRGQGRRLEGFAVELTGPSAGLYDVSYMAHVEGKGDTPFARNGEYCGTRGESRRVEGIRIRVTPR